jgi:hypothetical protein
MLLHLCFANNISAAACVFTAGSKKKGFAMSTRCRLAFVLLSAAMVCLFAGKVCGQDAPSLGDLARQQRLQKEQSKATTSGDAKAPKVITNEEIPEHAQRPSASAKGQEKSGATPASSAEPKLPAEHWRSQILTQKNQIEALQREVDELNESIRFAPANCAEGCVGWNERQREKQQRAGRMQQQLEEQKRRLEDMQDAARRQGYGSSIYDP